MNWLMTKFGLNWLVRAHRARTGPEPHLLGHWGGYMRTYSENLRNKRQSERYSPSRKREIRMLVAKMIHLSSSRQ